MSESAKTIFFVIAAAASLLAAFVFVPSANTFDANEYVGERLNQFEIDDAKSLKIIRFDKESAQKREFEVAESEGLWMIPSKQDYPADAVEQMAEAATCLINREILRVAATSASEHKNLGVVDPSSSKLGPNSEGVGVRAILSDNNDEKLADMIIGYEVKDAEGQHYVRNANQDLVYVVNLDPEKLSTKFSDWIEDDLLQLSTLDIRKLTIKDYSSMMQLVMTQQGLQRSVGWEPRGEYYIDYDDSESLWVADELKQYNKDASEFVAFQLGEDEELSQESLNDLRSGLDDLTLVDVERKPKGLSADLKTGEGFLNSEGADSLMERGFAPLKQSTNAEIISSEGELVCTLQDGVEYVLRFGNLKSDSESEAPEESPEEDGEESSSERGIHRYLFIMARFNKSMIEEPELEQLPELPAGATETVETEATETDESADADAPVEEEEEEDETSEAESTEASAGETQTSGESSEDAEADESEEDGLDELLAERERIEKDNTRRLNEYKDKIQEGEKRVQELNTRFGDWYYVIDNSVFKKIHLGREQLIKKKDAEGEGEDSEAAEQAAPAGIPGLPNLSPSN